MRRGGPPAGDLGVGLTIIHRKNNKASERASDLGTFFGQMM
jgi:hypothetical protein